LSTGHLEYKRWRSSWAVSLRKISDHRIVVGREHWKVFLKANLLAGKSGNMISVGETPSANFLE
jgi:hypothetical protein